VTALLLITGTGLNEKMAAIDRAAVGNLDPNVQAAVLGLSAVWLFALLLSEPISLRRPLPLAGWAVLLLLVTAVLLTSSRGGVIALLVTLAALPFLGGGRRVSPRAVLLALAGVAVLVLLAAQDETLVARIERSLHDGDIAGRNYIYASAIDMWWHRPLLGWGLGENEAELGGYVNSILRDTHSIYFYALTAGGLLGAALLLGMLIRAARDARLHPPGPYRRLALGGVFFVLVFGATVTILFFKFFWLALLLAAPLRAAAGGGARSPHLASRMATP
jgi:O-antigen ligase